MAFTGQHLMKRRMETKEFAVGEVRRVHIIYFLSRMGRIEHPHLIRVHHLNRNGVHLRDVKRWLSDLRGKDMPDSFSWSYKRRYKAGYVWQDLVDDDLITPISDNEYVLKGSEISSISFETCSCGEKKGSPQNPDPIDVKLQKPIINEKIPENPDYSKEEISTDTFEIDEESETFDSDTSTVSNDSFKSNEIFPLEEEKEKHLESKPEKQENSEEKSKKKNTEKTKPSATRSAFFRGKSYSIGASHVFRNLLKCGGAETNDSALTTINRIRRTENLSNGTEICKVEILGGSQRIFGSAWNQQQSNTWENSNGVKTSKGSESTNHKTVSAAYKPVAEPICSQCGKGFKPEKLQRHMKSCRGMKRLSKTSNVAEKAASQRSMDASPKEEQRYFLTH